MGIEARGGYPMPEGKQDTNQRLGDPELTKKLAAMGVYKELRDPQAKAMAERAKQSDRALAQERTNKLRSSLSYEQQLTEAAARYNGAIRASGEPMTPAIEPPDAAIARAKARIEKTAVIVTSPVEVGPVVMQPGETISPVPTTEPAPLIPFPRVEQPVAAPRPLAKVAGGSE